MRRDDVMDIRETDTGPASVANVATALEASEDPVHVLAGNATTMILDR